MSEETGILSLCQNYSFPIIRAKVCVLASLHDLLASLLVTFLIEIVELSEPNFAKILFGMASRSSLNMNPIGPFYGYPPYRGGFKISQNSA